MSGDQDCNDAMQWKSELQKELLEVAPSLSVSTLWLRSDSDVLTCIALGIEPEDVPDYRIWRIVIMVSFLIETPLPPTSPPSGGATRFDSFRNSSEIMAKYPKGQTPRLHDPTIGGREAPMTKNALLGLYDYIIPVKEMTQLQKALDHVTAFIKKTKRKKTP